jgi:transposase
MFKMLLVGYLYGVKSERRLVQEVQLKIALDGSAALN